MEKRSVYKEPGVSETDPDLLAQKEALKICSAVTVTYQFGSRSEILDGSTIFPWLSMDTEGKVVIDQHRILFEETENGSIFNQRTKRSVSLLPKRPKHPSMVFLSIKVHRARYSPNQQVR